MPRHTKGRSLGERPAFLRSPPGCGVIEALGVWEGGFDERPGEPPAGVGKLGWCGARITSAARCGCKKPFGYELQQPKTVSNEDNLSNETDPRYLQNCISELGYPLHLLGFLASLRQQIGEKGDAGLKQITVWF